MSKLKINESVLAASEANKHELKKRLSLDQQPIYINYEEAESEGVESYSEYFNCPNCDENNALSVSENYNFCPYCGCKIEWFNNPRKKVIWTGILLRELVVISATLKMSEIGYTLMGDEGVCTAEELKYMRSKVSYYKTLLDPNFPDFEDYIVVNGQLQLREYDQRHSR